VPANGTGDAMTKKQALDKLTADAKEAQASGANQSEIYNAVRLDEPPNPLLNPKPPYDPLAGT